MQNKKTEISFSYVRLKWLPYPDEVVLVPGHPQLERAVALVGLEIDLNQ